MKVLIVDDSELNRKLLRVRLESHGCSVVEAGDGSVALAMLESQTIDLVITDLLMPRIDGYALCTLIRSDDRTRHIPILAMTATYLSEDEERASLAMGADRYVRKPIQAEEIFRLVDELFVAGHAARDCQTIQEKIAAATAHSVILNNKLDEKRKEILRLREMIA